jgi:hypothetical protein
MDDPGERALYASATSNPMSLDYVRTVDKTETVSKLAGTTGPSSNGSTLLRVDADFF